MQSFDQVWDEYYLKLLEIYITRCVAWNLSYVFIPVRSPIRNFTRSWYSLEVNVVMRSRTFVLLVKKDDIRSNPHSQSNCIANPIPFLVGMRLKFSELNSAKKTSHKRFQTRHIPSRHQCVRCLPLSWPCCLSASTSSVNTQS